MAFGAAAIQAQMKSAIGVGLIVGGMGGVALASLGNAAQADDATDARGLFGDIDERALRYEFLVDEGRVGIGEGRIVKTGPARWRVEISYDIDVDLLGVGIYDLNLEAVEIYEGSRLVSLESKSVEDGVEHLVSGEAKEDHFAYTHNGEAGQAEPDVVPSTQLWRQRLLERTRVLHVIEGKPFDRTGTPQGEREVESQDGETITVSGVHIETPFETADLWYDAEGLLQQAEVDRTGVVLVIKRLAKE